MTTDPSSSAAGSPPDSLKPVYTGSQTEASSTSSAATGPTQGTQTAQNSDSPFAYFDPHAGVLFSSTQTLIEGLGSLNNFLEIFSKSVLQHDLKLDGEYAAELQKLTFMLIPTGPSSKINQANLFNQRVQAQQGTLQALMKAHQNVESMDIQNASSTTSTQQQLSSVISQTFELITSISNSISTMSK